MSVLLEALRWLNDPLNWTGPSGVLALTRQHLVVTGLAVLLGALVAVPTGLYLGHRGRGATVGVVVSNTSRALPTLAMLTLFGATGLFGNTATALACDCAENSSSSSRVNFHRAAISSAETPCAIRPSG